MVQRDCAHGDTDLPVLSDGQINSKWPGGLARRLAVKSIRVSCDLSVDRSHQRLAEQVEALSQI